MPCGSDLRSVIGWNKKAFIGCAGNLPDSGDLVGFVEFFFVSYLGKNICSFCATLLDFNR